jgi:hypothetical protein
MPRKGSACAACRKAHRSEAECASGACAATDRPRKKGARCAACRQSHRSEAECASGVCDASAARAERCRACRRAARSAAECEQRHPAARQASDSLPGTNQPTQHSDTFVTPDLFISKLDKAPTTPSTSPTVHPDTPDTPGIPRHRLSPDAHRHRHRRVPSQGPRCRIPNACTVAALSPAWTPARLALDGRRDLSGSVRIVAASSPASRRWIVTDGHRNRRGFDNGINTGIVASPTRARPRAGHRDITVYRHWTDTWHCHRIDAGILAMA